jgi:hypothetical protein
MADSDMRWARLDPTYAPPNIDTTVPSVARVYDAILGGKDNFAVDRVVAEEAMRTMSDGGNGARLNRAALGRAVRYMAERGVSQILDLGSGLPTAQNTHQIAQGVNPDARVVYVDNDPVVVSHGQALLGTGDGLAVVRGDLRQPTEILANPRVAGVLDFSQPVAVLCAAALHFVPDEEGPREIVAAYRDHIAPGSYLALTHGTVGTPENDPGGYAERVTNVYQSASANLHVRPLAEIAAFFDGFELLDPGVVWMGRWRPDPGTSPAAPDALLAGVGRKPAR